MTEREFYILSDDPEFVAVLNWVGSWPLRCEVHLNRTRFWVPLGPVYTEFALRWLHCCRPVDSGQQGELF
jgi:hypothetical protein